MVDYRDFKTGSIGIEEMQRGVLESRHVLLVLTPHFVNSDWTNFESAMGQTIDPSAKWRTLIPVLRETCELPLRLKMLHYRDLRTDDAAQWELLFRDLA